MQKSGFHPLRTFELDVKRLASRAWLPPHFKCDSHALLKLLALHLWTLSVRVRPTSTPFGKREL
jgi:hypothetical protein